MVKSFELCLYLLPLQSPPKYHARTTSLGFCTGARKNRRERLFKAVEGLFRNLESYLTYMCITILPLGQSRKKASSIFLCEKKVPYKHSRPLQVKSLEK